MLSFCKPICLQKQKTFLNILFLSKKSLFFQNLHLKGCAYLSRSRRVGCILWKGVYLMLCSLALQSLANLKIAVKNKATVDVHVICYSIALMYLLIRWVMGVYTYRRGASALLVFTAMGNARRLEERDE